jgi:hypothetical protein
MSAVIENCENFGNLLDLIDFLKELNALEDPCTICEYLYIPYVCGQPYDENKVYILVEREYNKSPKELCDDLAMQLLDKGLEVSGNGSYYSDAWQDY